jgi:L-cysteine/cystine lyase
VTDEADQEKVHRLREQLPAVHTTGYFNSGTNGPLPRVVHETILRTAEEEFQRGRIVPGVFQEHAARNDRARDLLARLLGGRPAEYALTQSTNDGLNIAFHGLDWQRGDEIITTSLEHPTMFMPMVLLSHRHGVRIRVANVGDGGGDVVAALEALIGPRTRVIALSHVLWSSGVVLDLAAITDMAHEHGILVIVDGAQSVGQVAVDIPSTGADAYTISGQKWLCGPEGTGALFIREDRQVDFAPSSVRYGQFDPAGFYIPAAGGRRYEMGENNPAAVEGFCAALTFNLEDVGLEWAANRARALGARFSDALSNADGVTLASPRDKHAGLVCFNVADMDPAGVADALYAKGFTIRYVNASPGPQVARASIGWWNTEDEVDALAMAVRTLATTASATAIAP